VKRRDLITLLGGAVMWPVVARPQQNKVPARLGFVPLGSPSNSYDRSLIEAFQRGLREVGLIENRDVILDVVWPGNDPDEAVSEVLGRGAELLIPCGSTASVAAQRRAPMTPIVFIQVGDPVSMKLVDSLARPGRNATGFSDILADISAKLVDIARELPNPQGIIGYLWYTGWPDGENRYRATEQAAQSIGIKLQSRGVPDAGGINDAIAAIKDAGATTLISQPSPFLTLYRDRVLGSAMSHGLATISSSAYARHGGLIGYGPDTFQMYRAAPFYVDRILKGANPAYLPVELPTKVELIVNLKTAKALGLTVPLALLVRADELIE
jgi:putative ABC transport system substrate-binding protein